VIIYDRSEDEIVWEWRFADHNDRSVGGNYTEDWTHVNDVDVVNGTHLLLSPRNFDQVVLVDRRTGEIEFVLGEDGNHEILHAQHNPDYLESEAGTPTLLVADSENDRIVEYARAANGSWTLTWSVGNSSTLEWPRDADRLPNGNTFIGDSRNNRVIEVTPEGEVVWEVYAPWLVYDVARVHPNDSAAGESEGPAMADLNASADATLSHAEPPTTAELERCDAALNEFENPWAGQTTSEPGADGTDGADGGASAGTDESTGALDAAKTVPGMGALAALGALLVVAAFGRRSS
jgi:hypothetical protein